MICSSYWFKNSKLYLNKLVKKKKTWQAKTDPDTFGESSPLVSLVVSQNPNMHPTRDGNL